MNNIYVFKKKKKQKKNVRWLFGRKKMY